MTKTKDAVEIREWTCSICGRACRCSLPKAVPTPSTCGQFECRALGTWPAERWAGQLRMAKARIAAGVELQTLDHEALRRETSK